MTIVRRLVPHPFISLFILGLWLVIASSYTAGSVVMGSIMALLLPPVTAAFMPDLPRVVRPLLAIGFFLRVCLDIVVANIEVARLILGPVSRLKPDFVDVPIDIEDPYVATIMASIISLTPGTVSIDIDMKARVIHVHALNLPDADALIREVKTRYEAPLKEIFGC